MKNVLVKKNLTQSIVLMAAMSAINIVVSVIAAFSVIASVFLIVLLPLTSTVVAVFCKTKYFPIYGFATVGLSLAATLWNVDMTLFYVIPSIVTGFVFGFTLKRGYHFGWAIGVAALFQAVLSLLFIPIINGIFSIDFIQNLLVIFKIKDPELGRQFIPAVFLAYAIIQTFLSYFIVSAEMKKFYPKSEEKEELRHFTGTGALISLSLAGFVWLSLAVSYLVLVMAFYFAIITVVVECIDHHHKRLISFGAVLLLNIFLDAILMKYVPENYGFLLCGATPACICLISFSVSFLQKKKEKIQ